MDKHIYEKRVYRHWVNRGDLARFEVASGTSDLLILADLDLSEKAQSALAKVRQDLEGYIATDAQFVRSLCPHRVPQDAPLIVQHMSHVAAYWGVGPMAAVAGAVAQAVGQLLAEESQTVIVENGGDVYAKSPKKINCLLYAGEDSPFSNKVHFEVQAQGGIGICTSSRKVGPSLSLGRADAVVAIADDAAFADAAATAIGNRIVRPSDVDSVLAGQQESGALRGLLACCQDRLGLWGDIELVSR